MPIINRGIHINTAWNFLQMQGDGPFVAYMLNKIPFSNVLPVKAGENISGGMACVILSDGLAHKYDILNESHYGKTVGIAKTAAATATIFQLCIFGVIIESGAGWTAGNVYYVGSNGILTATAPTSGNIKIMGVGIATDQLFINNNLEVISIA